MSTLGRSGVDLRKSPGSDRRRTVALAVISGAQLMFLLDATIVNVALPSIQESLRLDGSHLEWVVASYSIAFGGLLMLGGRAGDILGRRRLFTAGVGLFTVASLLGGFAGEPWLLTGCRILQGVGAAAASPAALALIAVTFPEGPERNRAVGWYTATATAGGGVGILAGGLIAAYLSWRWVFFVNVPIGLAVVLLTRQVIPEAPRRRGAFDVTGALTGTLAALLLVYGLIDGAQGGGNWSSWRVIAALGAAAVLIPVFAVVERRGRQPLVPLRLFADRTRVGVYAVLALTSTAMFGIFFFLTLFLQQVWHYDALDTAVVYIPLTCLLVLGAKASSSLYARFGARTLVSGGLLSAAAGMLWLSRIGDSGGYASGMLVPTVLTYAGLGVVSVPLTISALAEVADEDSGAASGLFSMARQIGGATGLAVLGTVVWSSVADAAPGTPAGEALSTGASRGFVVAAAITALALLVALATVPGKERAGA
ncbi:putative MFS-type transporter EfpA [Streptomyces sp. RB5]|uniref:Putative MFS-type transporter EfpA n=1 Tax=Streptomyces smaragdinus TaxID=2585196 RepID=A0A7K0CFU3_9ACTN|nr:MFS transporter [Streptomyces smaragdinus]MQY12350.1 putative MFS-type transporter EfpA [Streptomyces smaragdinus]